MTNVIVTDKNANETLKKTPAVKEKLIETLC